MYAIRSYYDVEHCHPSFSLTDFKPYNYSTLLCKLHCISEEINKNLPDFILISKHISGYAI